MKIDGGAVPIVDVITGGSPCQDLSVAGKRAGLDGERSGLFMEQMRIVKEMREASKQKLISESGENFDKTKISPRYMVWENVCTIFDTLVETANGLKKIGEIQVGELVRTHDGTYHKVVLVHKTEMQPTVKVKYQGGELVCTPNHPILVEDMTYKPACEFKVGDRVGFKVDEPGTKSIGMPIAYAFGRWLADGSVAIRNDRRTTHRIFISTGYKKYEDLKAELSKLPWRINEQKMDWAVNFTFSSDEFGELTDSAGYGARNKQVPEWVFDLVAEEQAEVLRGYLAGDGYQRTRSENHTECTFTTASEKLAYGIARLVRAVYHIGVSVSYAEGKGTTIIEGREVNAHDSWHCSFSIPSKYEHNIHGIAGASKFENGYVWCKIREISEGATQDVYNLSVEDNNTFIANGIVCHNCGAYSSGTPAGADFQAVLEEIARVVLNEVPTIPIPEDGWPYAGNLEGVAEDNTPFSICWRTHDAQYWGKTIIDNSGRVVKAGTPQRRRRIALVADFGGYTAPKILLECDSLPGDSEQSPEERQTTPSSVGTGIAESSTSSEVKDQNSETPMVFENHSQDTRYNPLGDVCQTVSATYGMGGNNQPLVVEGTPKTYKKDSHAKSSEDGQGWVEAEVNDTLNVFDQGDARTPTLVVDNAPNTIAIEGNGSRESHLGDGYKESDVMYTLNTIEQHAVCVKEPVAIESHPQDSRVKLNTDDINQPITANMEHDPANGGLVLQKPSEPILLESNQNHATVQTDGVSTTLPASMGEGGGYVPMVVEGCDVYNHELTGEVAATVTAACGGTNTSGPKVLMQGFDSYNQAPTGEVAKPLTNKATDSDHIPVVYGFEPGAAQRLDPENRFNEELAPTLRANAGDNQVAVVNVEMEVSVRKYEVDIPKLIECLQDHRKNKSVTELAEILNKPKTLVEHWFRKDKYFAIPDADIWMQLKELLQIDSDEFDKSIMTFETKPSSYDTTNRIHMGGVSPTLTAQGENTLYCVSQDAPTYGIDQQGGKGTAAYSEDVAPTMASDSHGTPHAVCYGMCSYDSNSMKSDNPNSGIYEADTSRTLDLNGGNPACNQGGMMVVQNASGLTDSEKDQVEDWVNAVNSSAKHQQDLIQSDLGVAHTIAPGTHASGPHLTKTLITSAVSETPIKESTKTYGVTTKGNGDAFIAEERHTALSTGGGEAGQGYPCILTEQTEPEGCLNPWEHQGKHIQSENGVAETLYAGETRYGGGESYVLQSKTYQDTTGALCAAGYSKLGTQEASNDMYVVETPVQCLETFHCTTEDEVAHPIKARDYKDPQVVAINDTGHQNVDTSGVAFTLGARDYKAPQTVAIDMGGGKSSCGVSEEQSPTLTTTHGGEPVVYGFKPDQGSKAQGMGFEEEKAPTLNTSNNAGVLSIENHPNDSRVKIRDDGTVQTLSGRMGTGGNNTPMVMESNPQAFTQNQREECRELGNTAGAISAEPGTHQQTFISRPVVRRLTPKECERLQGFPDNWTLLDEWVDTKGKKHKDSDSARYKALGNSIALPFWYWMSGRMVDQLRKSGVEHPTMASLFDGICGFPLVYAQHGCTPVWASEIEEFPIAVAKKHFGDDEADQPGDYEQYINNPAPFYIQNQPSTCLGLDRASFNQGQNAKYDFSVEDDLAQTLVSRGPGGVMTQ